MEPVSFYLLIGLCIFAALYGQKLIKELKQREQHMAQRLRYIMSLQQNQQSR
jgi:hypothetical protein